MHPLRSIIFTSLASLASIEASGFFAVEGTWETAADDGGCVLMTPLIEYTDGDMLIISSALRFIHVTEESVADELGISPHELRFEVILAHPFVEGLDVIAMEPPDVIVIEHDTFEPVWIPDTWHVLPNVKTSAQLLERLSTGSSVDIRISTETHGFVESLASEKFAGFEDALADFNACRSSAQPGATDTAPNDRPGDA